MSVQSCTPCSVTLGQIQLVNGITIDGAGARTTQITGNGSSRIFVASVLPPGATVTISGVTISGGGGVGDAGALLFDSGGATIDLDHVVLSHNTSGQGGAIELQSGTMNIGGSTIGPGNSAVGSGGAGSASGGAIYNGGGVLAITNSTISGNSATAGGSGGGIFAASATTLSFVTVAFNTASGSGAKGGNVFSVSQAFTATDSIVADGSGGSSGDCAGTISSAGHNLTDDIAGTDVASCGFTQTTDILADARLGPLLDNGGQTNTEALAAGSREIDAIPASDPSCTGTDQRGVTRPQGAGCDIGALEAGGGETAPPWSVAHDFRAPPNEANPSPDSLGNSGVWSYEQAPVASPQDPSTYTLLSHFSGSDNCATDPQDYLWNPVSGFPDAGFSGAGATVVCSSSVTLPRHTFFVDPAANADAVVAWRSPVQGIVDAVGSFESADRTGGSGIKWFVDKNKSKVVSGVDGRGGGQSFSTTQAIMPGDVLYFIVAPAPNGDASHDTTEFSLTITQTAVVAADLSLTAKATTNPVTLPAAASDTFRVANLGPNSSTPVTFSDPLPAGTTLQSASASQGTCSGTSTVTCALGTMASAANATVAVVLAPTQPGLLSNTATVTSATPDPTPGNNSATATTQVNPCPSSMTLDTVTVQADCIQPQGAGTFLASGNTSFAGGAEIVNQTTRVSAPLILDPAQHLITLAANSDGSAVTGVLRAGGQDIADGPMTIATNGVTDAVAKLGGLATIGGIQDFLVTLSGWTFAVPSGGFPTLGGSVAPSAYLVPMSDGGGALIDGQLKLSLLFAGNLSGALATQVSSDGSVNVIGGGVALPPITIPGTDWGLTGVHLSYMQGPDEWQGGGNFNAPGFGGVSITNLVIKQGSLDSIKVGYNPAPPILLYAPIDLELDGASLGGFNLENIDTSTPQGCRTVTFRVLIGPPTKVTVCPQPEIDGKVVLSALAQTLVGTGSFTYLTDGALTVTGSVAMEPPLGQLFSDLPLPAGDLTSPPGSLLPALPGNGLIQLANATLQYTPGGLFTVSGSSTVGPPGFEFLNGQFFVGFAQSQFTAEGKLNLVVPSNPFCCGGDVLGGVQALISNKGAAAQGTIGLCAPKWLGGGCLDVSLLVGCFFSNDCRPPVIDLNGGNINEFATVSAQADIAGAGGNRHTIRIPGGKEFAAFTLRSARGTPNVELISPRIRGRHLRLTLRASRRARNHSGALASISRRAHTESFLVALPPGGRWTVRRLSGPKIISVRVAVGRKTHATALPQLAPIHARDLPKRPVTTSGKVILHYTVPHAPSGTTVDIYCGLQNHGGGGILVAHGLPPSAAVPWRYAGLTSGRYWFYAIVNQHGIPVSIHYWPRPVNVIDPTAPPAPAGVRATVGSHQVLVTWHAVSPAVAYAVTASRVGPVAPILDAVPASQLGDILNLPKGRWSITVKTINGQQRPSLPSLASTVTVS